MAINFIAPAPYAAFTTRNGTYTADANGMIYNVPAGGDQIVDLFDGGCVPIAINPLSSSRNMIDGGDFTVNPWQRDVAGLATAHVLTTGIANTVTYFADRFFHVAGASSSVKPSKVADTSIHGFSQSLKVQRTASNADLSVIYTGQVLETADSIKAQGQTITLSFYAKAGANYSGGALTASIICGTSTNDSAANMVAGSWVGQANVATADVTLTTTMQRFSLSGVVPATATQLGILFQWTPTGTAGSSDSVSFQGIQLEIGTVSPFEHRSAQVELQRCLRHAWLINEPAASVGLPFGGTYDAATTVELSARTPTLMRAAPTLSFGTLSNSTWAIVANSATPIVLASTYLVQSALGANTVDGVNLTATTGSKTAGFAAKLVGAGGGSFILASADF